MAQINSGNQFMSLSALADGKCKASFQTEGIHAVREDRKPFVVRFSLLSGFRSQGGTIYT